MDYHKKLILVELEKMNILFEARLEEISDKN